MGSRRARYRHTSRVTETRAGPPGATPHTAGGTHARALVWRARAAPPPRARSCPAISCARVRTPQCLLPCEKFEV